MDEKKFCFIMCSNDAEMENECIKYISHLIVPEGYEIDFIAVNGAKSMTSGYNEGMNASDAKYKIYMHNDVYLINNRLLFDLLDLFEEKAVGMVGVVGVPSMPECGVMWPDGQADTRVGKWIQSHIYKIAEYEGVKIKGQYAEVEAVDGMFMATQYDLPWRDDLFDGWDFYDVSQSAEFIKAGMKVVVPNAEYSWCLHNSKTLNLSDYDKWRSVYLKHYKNKNDCETADLSAVYARERAFCAKVDELLASHKKEDFDMLFRLFLQDDFLNNTVKYSTKLIFMNSLLSILGDEDEGCEDRLLIDNYCIDDFMNKWKALRNLVMEIEFLHSEDALHELKAIINEFEMSTLLVERLIDTASINKELLKNIILE